MTSGHTVITHWSDTFVAGARCTLLHWTCPVRPSVLNDMSRWLPGRTVEMVKMPRGALGGHGLTGGTNTPSLLIFIQETGVHVSAWKRASLVISGTYCKKVVVTWKLNITNPCPKHKLAIFEPKPNQMPPFFFPKPNHVIFVVMTEKWYFCA